MIAWRRQAVALGAALGFLAGCNAQTEPAPVDRTVTLSWQANHEKGVNGPGGGYRLAVAGRAAIDLPWPAPTTLTTVLRTGSHLVTVQAYEPDPAGAGTAWSPTASLTVAVP